MKYLFLLRYFYEALKDAASYETAKPSHLMRLPFASLTKALLEKNNGRRKSSPARPGDDRYANSMALGQTGQWTPGTESGTGTLARMDTGTWRTGTRQCLAHPSHSTQLPADQPST